MGKILVVEDEDRLCEAITAYLKSQGATPLASTTVEQAMGALDSSEVDLMVLSLELNDGQCLDLLRHIRESSALADLPVIGMSAWDVGPVPFGFLEPGDYLVKPFDIRVLDWMIRQQLGLSHDQDLGAFTSYCPESPSEIPAERAANGSK